MCSLSPSRGLSLSKMFSTWTTCNHNACDMSRESPLGFICFRVWHMYSWGASRKSSANIAETTTWLSEFNRLHYHVLLTSQWLTRPLLVTARFSFRWVPVLSKQSSSCCFSGFILNYSSKIFKDLQRSFKGSTPPSKGSGSEAEWDVYSWHYTTRPTYEKLATTYYYVTMGSNIVK